MFFFFFFFAVEENILYEKMLVYRGNITYFKWDTHGFRLHVPEDALPPDIMEILVSVKAALGCEYILPANTKLVSGVYLISSNHNFTKPVTLEIEHSCLLQQSPNSANDLFFGYCSKCEPPFHFQIMKDGVFEAKNNFGKITLSNFSIYTILQYLMPCVTPTTSRYCASLHYSKLGFPNSWYIYLVISKDTGLMKQVKNLSLLCYYLAIM